jgi:hypothetical protein
MRTPRPPGARQSGLQAEDHRTRSRMQTRSGGHLAQAESRGISLQSAQVAKVFGTCKERSDRMIALT